MTEQSLNNSTLPSQNSHRNALTQAHKCCSGSLASAKLKHPQIPMLKVLFPPCIAIIFVKNPHSSNQFMGYFVSIYLTALFSSGTVSTLQLLKPYIRLIAKCLVFPASHKLEVVIKSHTADLLCYCKKTYEHLPKLHPRGGSILRMKSPYK